MVFRKWGRASRLHFLAVLPPSSSSFASAFLRDAVSGALLQAPSLRLTERGCPMGTPAPRQFRPRVLAGLRGQGLRGQSQITDIVGNSSLKFRTPAALLQRYSPPPWADHFPTRFSRSSNAIATEMLSKSPSAASRPSPWIQINRKPSVDVCYLGLTPKPTPKPDSQYFLSGNLNVSDRPRPQRRDCGIVAAASWLRRLAADRARSVPLRVFLLNGTSPTHSRPSAATRSASTFKSPISRSSSSRS